VARSNLKYSTRIGVGLVVAIALIGAAAAAPAPTFQQLLVEIKAVLPPENKPAFERAQRLWQDYANGDCEWRRSLLDGGSAGASLFSRCMAAKTRARAAEIKPLLCEGFGLTGPCPESARFDKLAD
jgi:hypothetical protein